MSDDEIKRTNRLPRHITLSRLDERKQKKKQAESLGSSRSLAFQNFWQRLISWPLAQLRFLLSSPSSASSVVLRALLWHAGLRLRLRYSNWKIAIDSICISGLNKSAAKLEKAEPLKFFFVFFCGSTVVIKAPLSK